MHSNRMLFNARSPFDSIRFPDFDSEAKIVLVKQNADENAANEP